MQKKTKIWSALLVIAVALMMSSTAIVPMAESFLGNATGVETGENTAEQAPTNDVYRGNPRILMGDWSFKSNRDRTQIVSDLPSDYKIDSYQDEGLSNFGVDVRQDVEEMGHYIVQFDDAVTPDMKGSVESFGAEIHDYVPYNAFIVQMDEDTKQKVANLPHVQYVGIYQPAYKLSKGLMNSDGLQPIKLNAHEGENAYNLAAGLKKMGMYVDPNVKVLDWNEDTVEAIVPSEYLDNVANWNMVKHIGKSYKYETMLDTVPTVMQDKSNVGSYTAWPIWDKGIEGQNEVVGIDDTGLDTDNARFYDDGWGGASDWTGDSPGHRKVVAYYADSNNLDDGGSGHGSHTSGLIAGNDIYGGISTGDGNGGPYGSAPQAKLAFGDVGSSAGALSGLPADMEDYFARYQEDGANISSHSWGTPVNPDSGPTYAEGNYSTYSQDVDEYMWKNKEYIAFYSAGNDRGATTGSGLDLTVTPPTTNKNGISVAANMDETAWTDIAGFSSYGPTRGPWDTAKQGRLKPDISAVGAGDGSGGAFQTESVKSAATDGGRDGTREDTTAEMQGTSMSCPVAAGDMALMRQYYREGWYPAIDGGEPYADNGWNASGALMKATMINGAEPITIDAVTHHPYTLYGEVDMDYPNNDEGWGVVDVEKSLYFNGEKDSGMEMRVQDESNGLMTGENKTYKYTVEDTSQPLNITMAYTDYPGTIASQGRLVNDLNLEVEAPDGTHYQGNFFGATSRESEPNPAGRGPQTNATDIINPVERVMVSQGNVQQGTYTIKIDAANVPKGPQDYALVMSSNFVEGEGHVQFHQSTYGGEDTVKVDLEDTDLGGSGSYDVTITSDNGDSETITLTEYAYGKFEGSIKTSKSTISTEDGTLQVKDGEMIYVTYEDTTTGTKEATADIRIQKPTITNVHAGDIGNTVVTIYWDTDIKSDSTVYYGTSETNLDQTIYKDALTTSHEVRITGLTGDTTYYYDVESTDRYGATTFDDNGGNHYSFTTEPNPDVLTVIEGSSTGLVEKMYSDYSLSLEHYNWTSSLWNAYQYGLPTMNAMNSAQVVMWDVGEGYPQLGASERDRIQQWLDQSGTQRFYPIGQDIGWDMSSSGTDTDTAWYNNYMHASFNQDDADGGAGNEADGTEPPHRLVPTTHPISDGFSTWEGDTGETGSQAGEQDLEQDIYGADRFWPDDITNDQGGDATMAWDQDYHAGGGDSAAISYKAASSGDYYMVYEPWAHAMMVDDGQYKGSDFGKIVDEDRAWIIDQTVQYLIGSNPPDISLDYPVGGETESENMTVQWSYGDSMPDSVDVQISDNSGQGWEDVTTGLSGTTTSYTIDTTNYVNGDNYRIRVRGYNGTTTGMDSSDSDFTIDNGASGDTEAPVMVAGSVVADPDPVAAGTTIYFNGTATDDGFGDSNIAEAEYFIDSDPGVGSANPMNPADGTFDSMTEDVTYSRSADYTAGEHTLYIRAKDSAGNWGSTGSYSFNVTGGVSYVLHDLGTLSSGGDSNGWNFVSFNLTANGDNYAQTNDLIEILNDSEFGIQGSYDKVMYYDAGQNRWRSYKPSRDGRFNDLSTWDNTRGVWIHMTADDHLWVEGSKPSGGETNVTLEAGWNMVAYPSSTTTTASNTLPGAVSKVGYFDATQKYNLAYTTDLTTIDLTPGEGYWVYADSATTWTVTY